MFFFRISFITILLILTGCTRWNAYDGEPIKDSDAAIIYQGIMPFVLHGIDNHRKSWGFPKEIIVKPGFHLISFIANPMTHALIPSDPNEEHNVLTDSIMHYVIFEAKSGHIYDISYYSEGSHPNSKFEIYFTDRADGLSYSRALGNYWNKPIRWQKNKN